VRIAKYNGGPGRLADLPFKSNDERSLRTNGRTDGRTIDLQYSALLLATLVTTNKTN